MRLRNLTYKWPFCKFYRGTIPVYSPSTIISQIPDCNFLLSIGGGTETIESMISDMGIQVVNHDLSFEFLKKGKRMYSVDGVNGVAKFLPYCSNSIECILFNESIGHMKLDESLKESYSVLRKGGKLIINNYKPNLYNILVALFNPLLIRYKRYSKEEFEKAAKNAGFKDVDVGEFDVKTPNCYISFIGVQATK